MGTFIFLGDSMVFLFFEDFLVLCKAGATIMSNFSVSLRNYKTDEFDSVSAVLLTFILGDSILTKSLFNILDYRQSNRCLSSAVY
jgi:hypothetical protein